MDRLGSFISRRRKFVLGAWITLLVVSLPFFAMQGKHLTAGGFEVPGSQSTFVAESIKNFPGVEAEKLVFVFDNTAGDTAKTDAAITKAVDAAKGVEGVQVVPEFEQAARAGVDKPIVLMALRVTGTADQTADAAAEIRKNADILEGDDAVSPIHLVGLQALWAGMQDLSKEDLEKAEGIGFPIVFIVLLLIFGSVAAALLPLSLGFIAVAITGAIVYFLAQAIQMSIFVTNISSMLGIGVAVDYSLFVLARYREEIKRGASEDVARTAAMRTSGLAVAFSGVTVIIALAGLFLIDSKTAHSMAIGAIVVVAVAVLAAVTLLPALIAMLGRRAYEPGKVVGKVVAKLSRKPKPAAVPFWTRWTNRLMKRPVLYASAATLVMLLIAFPALSMKLGTGATAQLPSDFETAKGIQLAAQAAGPGAGGPVQAVVDYGNRPVDAAQLQQFSAALKGLPGVAAVAEPVTSSDGRMALIEVTSKTNPEDDATYALVERIREQSGTLPGATLSVGGAAAQDHDFTELISGSMWKVVLFVLIFSYLVLLLVMRSVVLPLKAILMNLLSVGAAYGVLVIVFQWGWTDSLIGFDNIGYVNALTPPLILAIVFGLSMDYEVFLLSRIKERYNETHDNRAAVAGGLADSAKTITSAAVIMVLVFLIFATAGLPQVKEIGVGLAVAIFLDATIIRLVLVPTTMEMMGDWNWWVPKWLDKILPNIDFESSGTHHIPQDPEPEPAALVTR
ncbi:MAG TPA: MMPL family transporter [Thermoleophilaceae bacterium]|nr:MMPL family transporter [Thermoleophilaceae bacterium]